MPIDPVRVVLADTHAAVHELHQHQPQVLVLDLGMSNGLCIDVVGRLRREAPGSEIVALKNPAFERRAIDAGAIGFVVKDRAGSELPDAV